jgi:hypothetical protein
MFPSDLMVWVQQAFAIFSEQVGVCVDTCGKMKSNRLFVVQMASATKRPDKVVGTHFFAPAHIMRLLENVYGTHTSPQTVATVMELGRKINKVLLLCKLFWFIQPFLVHSSLFGSFKLFFGSFKLFWFIQAFLVHSSFFGLFKHSIIDIVRHFELDISGMSAV